MSRRRTMATDASGDAEVTRLRRLLELRAPLIERGLRADELATEVAALERRVAAGEEEVRLVAAAAVAEGERAELEVARVRRECEDAVGGVQSTAADAVLVAAARVVEGREGARREALLKDVVDRLRGELEGVRGELKAAKKDAEELRVKWSTVVRELEEATKRAAEAEENAAGMPALSERVAEAEKNATGMIFLSERAKSLEKELEVWRQRAKVAEAKTAGLEKLRDEVLSAPASGFQGLISPAPLAAIGKRPRVVQGAGNAVADVASESNSRFTDKLPFSIGGHDSDDDGPDGDAGGHAGDIDRKLDLSKPADVLGDVDDRDVSDSADSEPRKLRKAKPLARSSKSKPADMRKPRKAHGKKITRGRKGSSGTRITEAIAVEPAAGNNGIDDTDEDSLQPLETPLLPPRLPRGTRRRVTVTASPLSAEQGPPRKRKLSSPALRGKTATEDAAEARETRTALERRESRKQRPKRERRLQEHQPELERKPTERTAGGRSLRTRPRVSYDYDRNDRDVVGSAPGYGARGSMLQKVPLASFSAQKRRSNAKRERMDDQSSTSSDSELQRMGKRRRIR